MRYKVKRPFARNTAGGMISGQAGQVLVLDPKRILALRDLIARGYLAPINTIPAKQPVEEK